MVNVVNVNGRQQTDVVTWVLFLMLCVKHCVSCSERLTSLAPWSLLLSYAVLLLLMIRNLPESVHPLQMRLRHAQRNLKPTLDKATQTKTGVGEENGRNNLSLAIQEPII